WRGRQWRAGPYRRLHVRSDDAPAAGAALGHLDPRAEIVALPRDDQEVAGSAGPELIQQMVARVGELRIPGRLKPVPLRPAPFPAHAERIALEGAIADRSRRAPEEGGPVRSSDPHASLGGLA